MLYGFEVRNDVGCLTHAFALPCEDCLIDAEAAGGDREQSAVGRDPVTDRDGDYIAWDKLGGVDADDPASSEGFCFVRGVFLECLETRTIGVSRAKAETRRERTHTSIAFSAFVSWMTPTVAFAMRMRRITRGSTNAPRREPPSCVSTRARTKDTRAEASNMRTSWSLNWSSTNSHKGVEGSSGSSVKSWKRMVSFPWTADRDERAGTVCAVDFCVFCDLGVRETSGGVNLEVTQDLVRCLGPRVVHAEANSCAGRYGVGWA